MYLSLVKPRTEAWGVDVSCVVRSRTGRHLSEKPRNRYGVAVQFRPPRNCTLECGWVERLRVSEKQADNKFRMRTVSLPSINKRRSIAFTSPCKERVTDLTRGTLTKCCKEKRPLPGEKEMR